MGTTAADIITGNGGVDRFFAGAGNDIIVLGANDAVNLANNTPSNVKSCIYGGHGIDTIRLTGGMSLDLTRISNAGAASELIHSRINSIEKIDLGGADNIANTLTLRALDVVDMSGVNLFNTGNGWSNNSGGTALGASNNRHQLVVNGAGSGAIQDKLDIDEANWTKATGTVSDGTLSYDVYNHNSIYAQLLVQQGVLVI